MTRFALSLAALATAAALSVLPATAEVATQPTDGAVQTASPNIRLAQANTVVRKKTVVKKKVVRKPVVKKKVIVRKPAVRSRTVVTRGRNCRNVTVRKRVGGKTVVTKTRRCS
jgi:hypothetical protein